MPHSAARPCSHPGCPALVRGKPSTCAAHTRAREQQRGHSAERGYGWRWRKASERYRRLHPLCECDECKALGRVRASEVVDHRIPHRGDDALLWDESNWQAMAKRCHDAKTAREDGGFGR
jgi:5-methylcytosine-specific restriction protein A